MLIQLSCSLSTYDLVLSPDGHHSTRDGGNDGTDRMPLKEVKGKIFFKKVILKYVMSQCNWK